MTPEEHSSSAGGPELDLDEENPEREEEDVPVDGGLLRLDAPDSRVEDESD